MELTNKTCWVVGASSGIGAAVAQELLARGARVAISARRQDKLDAVAGGNMLTVTVDVTDKDSLQAAAKRVRDDLGPIDLVVLCAGTWTQMDPLHWDPDAFAAMVGVNLVGMSNGLAAVLPDMLARRSGVIAGVASVAGYRGLSGAEGYGPTKAAQINLLESLRISVAAHGVRVTTICPGFVRTELTATNSFPMPFIIEPAAAAKAICDGLERDRNEIVFPAPMAVLAKAARLVPVSLWASLWIRSARSQKKVST